VTAAIFFNTQYEICNTQYESKFNLTEETMKTKRIAVIGAGNIGKMLLERMGGMGVPGGQMGVCDADTEKAKSAAAASGASVFDLGAGWEADVWLLCSGPKTILAVLKSLAPGLKAGQVVISFAAAVPLAKLEALVPAGVEVVRIMPNMPSLVGQGMNPVCFGAKTSAATRAWVLELLGALGKTIELRDDQMNWGVGLSGAAMRAVLPVIDGMIRAGLEAGLSEADARLIASQVVLGAAELVQNTSLSLAEIKSLTPMGVLDEPALESLIYEAAAGAKKKVDGIQETIG
jgi:pyrroline-5-carboxylate reductase